MALGDGEAGAPAQQQQQLPAAPLFDSAHCSILAQIVERLDIRSRVALASTSSSLRRLLGDAATWTALNFVDASAQRGLEAASLFSLLQRAKGRCAVVHLARSEEAREAEGEQRFCNGFKADRPLPYTRGLRAYALCALLPALQHLSIDERASCIGGFSNDLARGLASHCKQLRVLEVFFERYSAPSELFTDEGLIALSEGCRCLARLALHNCDRISDRSLYAVAANCPGLGALTIGGYNEHITDGGATVLFEACRQLTAVRLSSKLLKVTDASGQALARCASLSSVKLTQAMGDATVLALAASCKQLEEAHMHRCSSLSAAALLALLASCPRLRRLVLPQRVALDARALPQRCSVSVLEEQQVQVLALQH